MELHWATADEWRRLLTESGFHELTTLRLV